MDNKDWNQNDIKKIEIQEVLRMEWVKIYLKSGKHKKDKKFV